MLMTRRYFLRTTGALAAYCGVAPFELFSKTGALIEKKIVTKGKTLVVVFLRGGMDGLNFIVPFGDRHYYDLRKSIAIGQPGSENGALDLNGFFGLHPRAASLVDLIASGEAVALQAVGYAHNTRSHFEEQDTWETGIIGNTVGSDGWLNRHLATSEGHGQIRAVSIGDNLPRILRGKANAYAIRGLDDLTMPGDAKDHGRMMAALEHAYCTKPTEHYSAARDMLAQTGEVTLEGMKHLNSLAASEYKAGAEYPNNSFGKRMREVARLIKADVGLEVAEVDLGGWDTHNRQGGVSGSFGNLVQTLADGLSAFYRDMGDRMNDVLVLTLSDFGRTAHENGTQGTDHGWANSMLAMGGPVLHARKQDNQRVLADWPGLSKGNLHQGRDLLHTIDFRDVIGEVVSKHLGNNNVMEVLPGHEFKPVGLI